MPTPAPDRPAAALDVTQEYVKRPAAQADTSEFALPSRSAGALAAGTTLGGFRVMEKLGDGGMGSVYRAEQVARGRQVALKVVANDVARRPGFVRRFHREARAMGRLDHPNIIHYLAAGEGGGFIYLAMELVEGGSLASWIDRLGRLAVPDAIFVVAECAKALQYAHGRRFVHRDVKPDNLLLSADGRVKLADLGLAKPADDDPDLTRTGIGIGTPMYVAPEQARDAKHADARSDLYALGGVLYHCLTGRLPFPNAAILDVIAAKEKGVFLPASRVNPAVPAALDLVLFRLLARWPEHRYQSCDELLAGLSELGLGGDRLSFLPAGGVSRSGW